MRVTCKGLAITGCVIVGIGLVCGLMLATRQTRNARLVISFSHFETHDDTVHAVVKIENVGTHAASFHGYSLETPFYYIVTLSGTNWLWDYSPGFDWDQARPVRLPPGASTAARTGLPIPETWMVGIPYRDSTTEDRLTRRAWLLIERLNPLKERESIAWSEPLTRSSKPSNIVRPLTASNREQKN